jgi:esterase/lipase superfamily enzyme
MRQAAVLAYDLAFEGVVVVYSWPTGQTVTETDGESHSRQFAELLRDIHVRGKSRKVHVIAVGAGAEITARALTQLTKTDLTDGPPVGEAILINPQLGAFPLEQLRETKGRVFEHATLYTSGPARELPGLDVVSVPNGSVGVNEDILKDVYVVLRSDRSGDLSNVRQLGAPGR